MRTDSSERKIGNTINVGRWIELPSRTWQRPVPLVTVRAIEHDPGRLFLHGVLACSEACQNRRIYTSPLFHDHARYVANLSHGSLPPAQACPVREACSGSTQGKSAPSICISLLRDGRDALSEETR